MEKRKTVSRLRCLILIGQLCLVFIVGINAQGHNGCKDDNWSYHASTHSCFRLFRVAKLWFHARNHCKNIFGGPTGSEKGNLAKIDDEETNTFVKSLLDTNGYAWIGLNDATERGTLRWAGFLDEVPRFIKLREDQRTNVYAYISTTTPHWNKLTYDKAINQKIYFICQSDAGIIESTLTCPRPGPVRQNTTLTRNPTITFAFSQWQVIYWYVNAKRVGYCTSQTCKSEETGFASTYTDGSSTLTYGKPITTRYEGKWTCKITTAKNVILADKSCAIDVYEPPDVMTCSHKLEKDKVSVVCKTNRIYPKVSCKWYHKNEKDDVFIAVDKQEVSDKNDESYTEGSNRDKYFKSSCSVDLTKSLTNVQLGQMTVKVRMYPTLNNYDLSTTQGAYSEKEVTVLIESPKKPVFYLNETKVVGNSLDVVDGETIDLKCAVKGGNPSVETTAMKCGSSSGPAMRGVTYRKEIHVTRSTNGQRCECFGNHITGKSETTVLTLKVLYAASVHSFTASRYSSTSSGRWTQLTVNLKTQVYLTCQSSGNPSPDTKILKRNVGTEDKVLKSTTGVDPLKTSFKAECLDNGKYQCLAENTVRGKRNKKTSELDIHVRCPPTLCKGQEDNSSFVANVGQRKVVKICAVSYPKPSQSMVNLLQMTTGKWKAYDSTKFSVRHVLSSSNTLKEVEITFNQIQSSDHGQFRVYYYHSSTWGQNQYSNLHFQLSPKGPPDCPTNVTVDMLGRLEANISWVPGAANGHPQTFVIAQYKKHATQDKRQNVSDSMQANSEDMQDSMQYRSTPPLSDAIKNYTVEESVNSDGDPMAFLLTDLKPGHEFIFFVVATNELGSRKCPDAFVNFTTMPEQESQTGDGASSTAVVAIVVPLIIIIIIILVIIGVIVFRRRKEDSERSVSFKDRSKNTSTPTTNDGKVTLCIRKPSADLNNTNRMAAEGVSRENINAFSNEPEDYLLDGSKEGVYSNDVGKPGVEETVYSNTPASQQKDPNNAVTPQPQSPIYAAVSREGSRRNQDGLIYVDVVIDPASKRPTMSQEQEDHQRNQKKIEYEMEKKKGLPVTTNVHDDDGTVEYTTVDLLATAELKNKDGK